MKSIDEEEILRTITDITDSLGSLMLSTVDENGLPHASYAPFVEDEKRNFYIYISSIAKHFNNLEKTKKATLLFIEDEQNCTNIFARKRIYGLVDVEKFEKDDSMNKQIHALFVEKFGKSANFLKELEDFRIFKFCFEDINLVLNFGVTYNLNLATKNLKQKG